MITIQKSKTADTRTCDYANVTIEQLKESSLQHIKDVAVGMDFFMNILGEAALTHDHDKLSDIKGFHSDFLTGFKEQSWYDNHKQVNRHHLLTEDGVREDVNLVDIIEMVVDCVMAGMGRSGEVYPLELPPELLAKALENTVNLLKDQIIVEEK